MLLHPSVMQQNVVSVLTHVFEKPAIGINGFETSILKIINKNISKILWTPLCSWNIYFKVDGTQSGIKFSTKLKEKIHYCAISVKRIQRL